MGSKCNEHKHCESFHASFQPYNQASNIYYPSTGLYLNERFSLHQFVWTPVFFYTLQTFTRNVFKNEQLISHRIKHTSSHISGHKSAVAVSCSSLLQTAESVPFPQRKYYQIEFLLPHLALCHDRPIVLAIIFIYSVHFATLTFSLQNQFAASLIAKSPIKIQGVGISFVLRIFAFILKIFSKFKMDKKNPTRCFEKMYTSLCVNNILFLCIDYIFNAKIHCISTELGSKCQKIMRLNFILI